MAAVAGILGGAGCVPGQIYSDYAGEAFGMKITPKHSWKPSGTIANALDLNDNCVFMSVIIDHGESQHAFARSVCVATSVDGKVFVNRYTAGGTRRVTHLLLPKPVLARYVRLQAVAPGPRPWSIAEVYHP